MTSSTHKARRQVCAIGLLASLSACATPANPAHMAVGPTPTGSFPEELRHAMCVRTVTGGKETNPLFVADVDNQDLSAALTKSMDVSGLIAPPGECKYLVDVNLLGVLRPESGFDMKVSSHANYKVYNMDGQPVLLETISASYTAKASDAFVGIVRLKLATEGSIRASISQFLEKLRELRPQ